MTAAARYVRPGRGTAFFNSVVAGFTRAGISIWGSRVLGVRGRRSGEMRTTPVNLLTVDGERYLVSPRGVTQWVRNIRVAEEAELRIGRRVEQIHVQELADDEKPAILRPYLKRWKFEVGVFFDGVDDSASDGELRQIGPKHPVFRVLAAEK
jgi:deazaflavin-dependent oxidoreductase (nitroreductase family)